MNQTEILDPLPETLAAIAARQRGVFTGDQARAAGYSSAEIQRMRRNTRGPARWLSVRRGVYAVRDWYVGLPAHEQHRVRAFALHLVLTEPAVHSHESAAVELGLALLEPDLSILHVTRGELEASRVEAGVHHHAAELPDEHVMHRPGQPSVTTRERTAVDVARSCCRLAAAVAICDSVLRDGVPADQLTEVAIRCRSWPGARMAGRAVLLADGRAANPGESWSRVLLIGQGQPPTDLQVPFYDTEGLIGYVDFFWERERTIGEFDGQLKYRVPADADRDTAARILMAEKRREDRLRALGLEVVRWGWADNGRPRQLMERIAAARARGAARVEIAS